MDRFNNMRATSSAPFQETDPTVPAWVKAITQSDIANWDEGSGGTTYTAGANVQISNENVISATDTTYSAFTGTDGSAAGAAGLVPAPSTSDAGKFLNADGTWVDVEGGLPTLNKIYLLDNIGISTDGSTAATIDNGIYYVNSVYVNGTTYTYRDADMSNSIVNITTANGEITVSQIAGVKAQLDKTHLCKSYMYSSDAWSVTVDRSITYSTTDLTAGTSPLPTGALYFVYE